MLAIPRKASIATNEGSISKVLLDAYRQLQSATCLL
jgi:hypothetical protein